MAILEARRGSFLDIVDDPDARMGATSDVEIRFKIEPTSSGVKDKVTSISFSCMDHCLRRVAKFVRAPGSAIQMMLDLTAE